MPTPLMLTEVCPIFIPSKNRADKTRSTAINLLDETGLHPTIVVEPHEVEDYRFEYPNCKIAVLEKSNQGLPYARQSILEYNRMVGNTWFWLIDDNIGNWYEVRNRKTVKIFPEVALLGIQKFVDENPFVAMAAATHQQYAWSYSKDYGINKAVFCCVLMRSDTGVNYDPAMNGVEDADIILQTLLTGHQTLVSYKYAMSKPTSGVSKGGQEEFYKDSQRLKFLEAMRDKYPEYVSITEKGRRPNIKINWRRFNGGTA